ncbi:N-6 DNA methylase [Curtobacterium sp. MCBD17_032]|uniref:N-6 DNA methylase n=1 Tax=Curtobacterium sp. MCBD17_032 TaxID=2175659 RepID=UPI000DA8B07D|nr:N-6 DNA methylase [Curtobacterium sp. MCBD17_032]PZE80229.1 hypothetical protein DEI91_14745 [Curtobacterium sp. MCBD17_032]
MHESTSNPTEQLVDVAQTASIFQVSASTIRSWRRRQVSWLPAPVAQLNGGAVWLRSEVSREAARYHHEGYSNNRTVSLARDRAAGRFYTPSDTAHFLADWLLRAGARSFLEPSFGDAAFIVAVNEQAEKLGLERVTWIGAELDVQAVKRARLASDLLPSEIRSGNFLALEAEPVDAVMANPPYVRLRHLDEETKRQSRKVVFQSTGELLSPSASLWLPFLIHSISFLNRGGMLAMVLPSDFTYVRYARKYWGWLSTQFEELRVVRVRQRLFPDLNQDVILLLASGHGGATQSVKFEAYESVPDLIESRPNVQSDIQISKIVSGERSFQRALAGSDVWSMLQEEFAGSLTPASDLMRFRIGYVAGDKDFFHPPSEVAEAYDLPAASLRKSITNGRRLKGHGLSTSKLPESAVDELWLPTGGELSDGELRYVRYGEQLGVSSGYKASRRDPWFRVPTVEIPDLIMTVFSESPLVLINDAELTASNSLLCGYLISGAVEQFVLNWYSPLTQLSIASEVHSLGGGVMVLVPNEANSVLMSDLRRPESDLLSIAGALASGNVEEAYLSGRAALENRAGAENVQMIIEATERLHHWRVRPN